MVEDALSAVSWVITALTISIGVGMSQVISQSLRENNQKKAASSAVQGLFLSGLCFVLLALFGLLFSKAFYDWQNVSENIAVQGSDYLRIITIFSLGIFTEIAFERMLISTSHARESMICRFHFAISVKT
nr:MATE family efflux transporter [Peptoniphilus sp. KCTC 25270]